MASQDAPSNPLEGSSFVVVPDGSNVAKSWDSCLCHCVDVRDDARVSLSDISYSRVVAAARVRQDSTWDFLLAQNCAEECAPCRGWCHRRCYASYTHKKSINKLRCEQQGKENDQPQQNTDECESAADSNPSKRRSTRSALPKTNMQLCLFCQRSSDKRVKGKVEKLTQCHTFEAGEKILVAAVAYQDQRIQLLFQEGGPDCIAAEFLYHHSCYRNYTHGKTVANTSAAKGPTISLRETFRQAFNWLAGHIENDLFSTGSAVKAIRMDCLTSKYQEKLRDLGVTSSYRTFLLKKRIVDHFNDRVMFVRQSVTEPESLAPATLTPPSLATVLAEAVTRGSAQSQETDSSDSDVFAVDEPPMSMAHDIFHAALQVRSDIKAISPILPDIPHESDLTEENASRCVPDSLYNFLAWVLCVGDIEDCDSMVKRAKLDAPKRAKVLSLGQDIVYAATRGRIITPKSDAFPMTVCHLTRSSLRSTPRWQKRHWTPTCLCPALLTRQRMFSFVGTTMTFARKRLPEKAQHTAPTALSFKGSTNLLHQHPPIRRQHLHLQPLLHAARGQQGHYLHHHQQSMSMCLDREESHPSFQHWTQHHPHRAT